MSARQCIVVVGVLTHPFEVKGDSRELSGALILNLAVGERRLAP